MKKRLQHRFFPANFATFLRTAFFIKRRWMILECNIDFVRYTWMCHVWSLKKLCMQYLERRHLAILFYLAISYFPYFQKKRFLLQWLLQMNLIIYSWLPLQLTNLSEPLLSMLRDFCSNQRQYFKIRTVKQVILYLLTDPLAWEINQNWKLMQVWSCVTWGVFSLPGKVSLRKNLEHLKFNDFIKKLLKLWSNKYYHLNFRRYHLLNVFLYPPPRSVASC